MSPTSTLDTPRVQELGAALQKKGQEMDAILGSITDEGGGQYVLSPEKKADFDRTKSQADEIKGLIDMERSAAGYSAFDALGQGAEAKHMESKGLQEAAMAAYKAGGTDGVADVLGVESKSLGDLWAESQEFKDYQASNGRGSSGVFSPEMERKDVYTTMPGTFTNLGFGRTQREPMVLRQHRTQRVRDLFGVRQTKANLIEYYRVTGLVNNAAAVPERDTTPEPDVFGLKPKSSLTFAPFQDPIRTIAHWEAAHRNVLSDEPMLRSIIDNELQYGLRLTEDAQILSGSGAGENVLGLLNRPGIQTYLWSQGPSWGPTSPTGTLAADNKADAVRRAITKVILSNYEATGVIMHPLDWEDIEVAKDENARYLITVAVAIGAEQRLWRLPVVDTPVIPQSTFLTGAFGLGAHIYEREAPSIRMAEEHSDFFVRNAIAILCEERLGLTVPRPESIVRGTFNNRPAQAV